MDGVEMKRFAYCSLLLILLLTGCTVPQLERPRCEEIANLRAQIGKEVSPESFREWVSQTYHIPLETITVDVLENGQRHVVHWNEVTRVWSIVKWEEVVQVWYSATIEGLVVENIRVGGGSVPASKVMACLGKPARYRAWYRRIVEGNQLSLSLLFADQGILAVGARFFRSDLRQPPPISDAFPLTGFTFTRPGSAEQLFHRIYSSEGYEQMLREHRPWPDSWEDIVIGIDPNLRQ